MLCTDDGLRKDLGVKSGDLPDAESFLEKIKKWCQERQATTFAIVAGDISVGTISLSHRNHDEHTAEIGYWVGTNHRRQGYCKHAFEKVLQLAASEGIISVSAITDTDNKASRRIWERLGAANTSTPENRIKYELSINPQ